MNQLSFFSETKTSFGGEKMRGRRKTMRPLDSRRPLFLTLKATSPEHFLLFKSTIIAIVKTQSDRFGARVYSIAIQADHLHFAIQFGSRNLYRRWIRATTGLLARKVIGVTWRHRPHSEIVNWGRHLQNVLSYIEYNQLEAGLIEWGNLVSEEFRVNFWAQVTERVQTV